MMLCYHFLSAESFYIKICMHVAKQVSTMNCSNLFGAGRSSESSWEMSIVDMEPRTHLELVRGKPPVLVEQSP